MILTNEYNVGDIVALHPATDAWMMGDRIGEIVKVGYWYVHVRMDRSGRTLSVPPADIGQVVSTAAERGAA